MLSSLISIAIFIGRSFILVNIAILNMWSNFIIFSNFNLTMSHRHIRRYFLFWCNNSPRFISRRRLFHFIYNMLAVCRSIVRVRHTAFSICSL
ncbi:Os06g0292301 [Oryza sativa Japonica Group]|uniref:Os06g0292301 protein n=1 Tax=Oryza sativa subsp. japonica TaxID=39947 RepID=A0A0N7KLY5_ORYSJ|nr:hypothetical protein EE612_033457 [Oryza sativa]BAS97313.1 Os06g0292301 [Oryza sativa Japonica Group]